jgi:hypothetical protein
MEYTLLDLGIDFLPYWDDETETTEDEQSTETTELNNIELPF